MDFFGIFQWLFGLGQGHLAAVGEKKNEIARLSAEIGSDVGRCSDLLLLERNRLLAKCERICPGDVDIRQACMKSIEEMQTSVDQLALLVQQNRARLDAASALGDWDTLLRGYYEWRGTASRLVPWIEGTIRRLDDILDQENLRTQRG